MISTTAADLYLVPLTSFKFPLNRSSWKLWRSWPWKFPLWIFFNSRKGMGCYEIYFSCYTLKSIANFSSTPQCPIVLSCSVISNSLQHHQTPLPIRILQARILEWVAMPSSRGSSQPGDWAQVSGIAGRFFTIWSTREANNVPLASSNHQLSTALFLRANRFFCLTA